MSDPTRHTSDPNRAALEELADALDLGAGRFSLHLVRCRYRQVQEQLATQLQDICRDSYNLELERITLEASAQNLYTSIQQAVGDRSPQALMVLGIEQVANLDEVLGATENAREEFRKNFHFPLVLWLDDDRYIHFTRQAPNIASWSPGTTDLAIAPDALQSALHQTAEQVSEALLEQTTLPLAPILQKLSRWGMFRPAELPLALEDFQHQELTLEPKAEAMLRLAIAFQQGDIRPPDLAAAQQNFRHSADFWAQHLATGTVQPEDNLRAGLAHFFLGRHLEWVCDQQRRRGNDISNDQWTEARRPLEEAIRLFELGDRPDLAAKCLTPFQRVLTRVGDWDTLEAQTQRALELHHIHNDPLKLAQDYGFLSRVHLERKQWAETQQFATQALDLLDNLPPNKAWLHGLYRLHLAEAEHALGNPERAIALLQEAQRWGDRRHPLTYCRILNTLRDLYWGQGRYLEAFKTKQKRLEVEKDAGIRAFVGAGRLGRTVQTIDDLYGVAPEIEASGRKRDLERLLERIGRNDYKLVVIHGSSGVGKSSLVNAGLIPALKQQPIGTKDNLTLVFRQYTSWMEEFWEQLAQELERLKEPLAERPTGERTQPTLDPILAYFQQLYHNPSEVVRFRSVLIFDQFEEFFFAYPDRLQWRTFFEFLGNCLDIPDVKVVLSLREDYIHYLLEANRSNCMGAIGHDILGRQVLYPLGNLSLTDARATIQDLTRRSRFSLAPDLIDRLVEDLGGSLKEVRPIEMQIVGAQLQTEGISTLDAYQALGARPPEVLVERYLEEVYRDCAEHSQLASLVLFLLTDERGTRPLKTRSELEKELATLLPIEVFAEPTSPADKGGLRGDLQRTQSSNDPPKSPLIRGTLSANATPTTPLNKGGSRGDPPQPSNPDDPPKSPLIRGTLSATDVAEAEPLAPLDLVLRVICGSGIGVFLPEEPEGRYQLVHDYIAEFVRKQQKERLTAELGQERKQRLEAEAERAFFEEASHTANQRLQRSAVMLLIAFAALAFAVPTAMWAYRQAETAKEDARTARQEKEEVEQAVGNAQEQLTAAEAERQEAEERINEANAAVKAAQEDLDATRTEWEKAEEQVRQAESQLAEAAKAVKEAEAQVLAAEEQQEAAISRSAEAQNTLDALQEEYEATFTQLDEVSQSLAEIQGQFDLIQEDLVDGISATLELAERQTGVNSVVLYMNFNSSGASIHEYDTLNLWLISDEFTVRRTISNITRDEISTLSNAFRNEIEISQEQRLQYEARSYMPSGQQLYKTLVRPIEVSQEWRFRPHEARSYMPLGQQLYNTLIRPIEDELIQAEADHIIFLASPEIREIPFPALHDGQQFLIEKYALSIMPGLTFTDARYSDLRNSELLAVGVYDFQRAPVNNGEIRYPNLPGVELEIQRISTVWPQDRLMLLLNEEASFSNFRSLRDEEGFQIVHLATHSNVSLSHETPEEGTFLFFWDTALYANEFNPQDWYSPPVELLVLSGGQLGVGTESFDFGFAGSAIRAGIKSVLADLFHTADIAYAEIMPEFYRQLQIQPTRAEALRQAQLRMLYGSDVGWSDPYYWSGFVLIGNPW